MRTDLSFNSRIECKEVWTTSYTMAKLAKIEKRKQMSFEIARLALEKVIKAKFSTLVLEGGGGCEDTV